MSVERHEHQREAGDRFSAQQVAGFAAAHGMWLGAGELDTYACGLAALLDGVGRVHEEESHDVEPATLLRDAGRRARRSEDPCNAIVRWCDVRDPEAIGALAGVRVAVKDSIAVAGVPLTCGSALLQGFVPERDSVVVRRVLAAGGTIAAVTNMDDLAISGAGDSSWYGPIRNPFDAARTAGGSSGGSAACLWNERLDVALGTDQAGSVRIPASWCGVLGLKPTRGLVPRDGVVGFDAAIDHVGPLARTTAQLALLLTAVADPTAGIDPVAAVAGAPRDLAGVRVALLEEGFAAHGVEQATAAAARASVARLAALGAAVEPVSLPSHLHAAEAYAPIGLEAIAALLEGGPAEQRRAWPALAVALRAGMRERGQALTPYAKLAALAGWWLREAGGARRRECALTAARALAREYDCLLGCADVVALPSTPTPARRLPRERARRPLAERLARAWSNALNTCQANLTGHPALSLPAASVDGLPVGLMLVAAHGAEDALLRIARVYERDVGWEPAVAPALSDYG